MFLKGKLLNDICNFLVLLAITKSLFQVVVPVHISIRKLLRVSECLYFLKEYLFVDLTFLAVLGLHCCVWTFSSCSGCSLLSVVRAFSCSGFSCCRAQALSTQASVYLSSTARGIFLHQRSNPALAGGRITSGSPGKTYNVDFSFLPFWSIKNGVWLF